MNILTFDIEDWFHFLEHPSTQTENEWGRYPSRIAEGLNLILSLLERHQQKATFFVMGWMAEQHPSMVRAIEAAGHDIGLHSYGHQLIFDQTVKSFREDLIRNMSVLEDILGRKVTSYRAPGFSIVESSLWALDVMAELGITVDASIFPTNRAHGGLASFPLNQPCLIDFQGYRIREFPINVATFFGNKFVFSGGGYFRLFPYGLIHTLTRHSPYVMSYFHPRDFDIEQPVLGDLSPIRKFRGYIGLRHAYRKLDRWLSDFLFIDIASAEQEIPWEEVRIVRF